VKHCANDHFEMICFKTGCLLEIQDKPLKEIDGKPYQWVTNGDLFYCPVCNNFQLCGAREPYYSPAKGIAMVRTYETINTGYNEIVGDIRVYRTIEMYEYQQKWYPNVEVPWEDR
jgi:hypothetical protein